MTIEQINHILRLYKTYLWLYKCSQNYYYFNRIEYIRRVYILPLREYVWFDEEMNKNEAFSWHKEQGDVTMEIEFERFLDKQGE